MFVSIPMDDWRAEVDDDAVRHQTTRTVEGRAGADPALVRALAQRLAAAANPVFVAGGDVDASGGWDAAVALAEQARLPVWAAPATGGGRIGFPEDHPHFQGVLPPAVGPLSETLAGHDLILVAGSSVFAYYPNLPGPLLPEGAALVAITSDPDEAARAPMGDAIVADVKLTLEALLAAVDPSERDAPEPQRAPGAARGRAIPMSPAAAIAALAEAFPDDGIVVPESPATTFALRARLRLSRPGSYYFTAGGGLGFALPASIGVQMAQPDRPVVCVLGEGSAQYAIQAFWTAAAYAVPVTFLVLRNEEYAILKWFGEIEQVTGAPGLDLPALDVASVAEGYGVESVRVDDPRGADRGAARRHRGATRRGSSRRASRPGWRSLGLQGRHARRPRRTAGARRAGCASRARARRASRTSSRWRRRPRAARTRARRGRSRAARASARRRRARARRSR